MPELIVMLTRNDLTVPNAGEIFSDICDIGVTSVGFKNIGCPVKELHKLADKIREEYITCYFECVSQSRHEMLKAAHLAVEIGADYFIGGSYADEVADLLNGTGLKYFPYVGKVSGHPSVLEGEMGDIINETATLEDSGVQGVNILAYRYRGDSKGLLKGLSDSTDLPIIVAGGIDTSEKIKLCTSLRVHGFTVGTAIFEKKFVPAGTLQDQIEFILRLCNR